VSMLSSSDPDRSWCSFKGARSYSNIFFSSFQALGCPIFTSPLNLRLVGAIRDRNYVKSAFSEWGFSKTKT